MEKSSFFNSISHDRTYKAEDWAEYFASFIGNGVFPVPSTGLQVVANDGMKLNVKTGKAWINGYFYFNTGDLAVELDTADGQLNRIDRVVVRWDLTNRVMSVKVKSSSFSASPTAPALQRGVRVCLRGKLRISAPTVLFAQSQGKMFKTKYISRQIGSGRNKRFEGFLLGRPEIRERCPRQTDRPQKLLNVGRTANHRKRQKRIPVNS